MLEQTLEALLKHRRILIRDIEKSSDETLEKIYEELEKTDVLTEEIQKVITELQEKLNR